MADLSGFRRYSQHALRRQSYIPRNSIASTVTTAQTGHSWLHVLGAMHKQTYSLCTGFSLCTCAVMIDNFFNYSDIYEESSDAENVHDPIEILTVAMYFLGACIGSIMGGIYPHTWPAQRTNYVIGSILIIACGLMFWINIATIYLARLLAGFSYGFIYIALTTHIADNAMKFVRGFMATTFSIAISFGFLMSVVFSENSLKTMPQRLLFNVILLLIPIASMILTRFLTYEPVTHLLKLDLEPEARRVLHETRQDLFDSFVIQHEIDEKKLMLIEDYDDKGQRCCCQHLFSDGNAMIIISILLLRLLGVFTSNIYLYLLSANSFHHEWNFAMLIVLLVVRILVLLIPKYSIDKLGRKNLLLASGIGSGIFLLPFAVKHMNYIDIRDDLLAIITFSIHIFAALGIDSVQHIYACEAFSLSKRNGSLAIVTCIEYIFHGVITVCVLLEEKLPLQILLLTTPFAVLLLTIISFVRLPETKAMSLRRCRDRFNKKTIKKPPPPRVSGIHTLGSTYI